jgi:hypothetical protein
MRKYSFNKASSKLFKVLCFFRPLSKEKERKKESREKEREQRETETHDEPLLLNFFVLKKSPPAKKKKRSKNARERATCSLASDQKSIGGEENETKSGRHTSHARQTISSWHSDKP